MRGWVCVTWQAFRWTAAVQASELQVRATDAALEPEDVLGHSMYEGGGSRQKTCLKASTFDTKGTSAKCIWHAMPS